MAIQINNTDITLRPSSIDSFSQCAYQWGKVFLEGVITIPNSRAAIGTAIHKGIEVMWEEAIERQVKDPYIDGMIDAGIESFDEEAKKDLVYNDGEDKNTCHSEIVNGLNTFVEELVPFLDIPKAVEKRFTIPLDNKLAKELSGTVDYIADGVIDDVKTSKRKATPSNYKTQQSIYKFLAIENGEDVKYNRIQNVVLTKQPKTQLLDVQVDIQLAKNMVNILLKTLNVAALDIIPTEVLFKPNPKYYLCSEKYCSLYGSCPATKKVRTK